MIPDVPPPPTPRVVERIDTQRNGTEEKSARTEVRKLAQALREASRREAEATARVEQANELTPVQGYRIRSDSKAIRRLRALRDAV